MPRGELSADEEAAGKIVAHQVGGAPFARDVLGAGDGTHDIDIELPDGRCISLEVTSARDEAIEALRNLALGRVREAPMLAAHWWIGLPNDGDVRVRRLMSQALSHLAVLEKHGVKEIGGVALAYRRPPAGVDEDAAHAARGLFGLGASFARRLDPPKLGEVARVMASLHGGAGSDSGLVNDLVAACAKRKAKKLAAADGHERHLFVWIHSSYADAELAMATLPPPASTPSVPEAIDVVWAATSGAAVELFEWLWHIQPPGGWEAIRPTAE